MFTQPSCRFGLFAAVVVSFIWPSVALAQKHSPQNFEQARNRMVDDEVVGAGITNPASFFDAEHAAA